MLIDDYAAWATKVTPARLEAATATEDKELTYLVLAMAGEVGEIADHVKRVLRDGTWDRNRLGSELGDLIYYWARLCTIAGCVPSEVLDRSVATIEARIAKQAARAVTS